MYAADADKFTTVTITEADIVDAKLGHEFTSFVYNAPKCLTAGNIAYEFCSTCLKMYAENSNQYVAEENALNDVDVVIPATGHALVYVNFKAPTCTDYGWVAHWHCENECGICYEEEAATTVIAEPIIKALGHVGQMTPAVAATCLEDGTVEYWTCIRTYDYDGDGVADIWDSFDDAIASAANYLSELGWKADEPWGQEVILPWNFDYNLVGPKKYKKVSEWKKIGVIGSNGKRLSLPNDASAVITLPDGRRGRAYITLSNFRRIMIWNRSTNYALAIVKLADYIKNNNNFTPLKEKAQYKLTDEDILTVQRFANRILKARLKEDGRFGAKTASAVKKLQKKWKLPQDGMPDYQLLYRIKNFKSWKDFRVSPQPKKPRVPKQKSQIAKK
jgi:hypothetical protein